MAPLAFRKRYWYAGLVMLLGLGMLILSGWIVYGNQFFPDLADLLDDMRSGNQGCTVGRIKNDLRAMSTAMEAYYVDYDAYPAMHPLREYTSDAAMLKQAGGWDLYTVEPGQGEVLHGLTTPIAYITSLCVDDFTGRPKPRFYYRHHLFEEELQGHIPFAYYQVGSGWLLYSPGPDLDYDIDPAKMYDPAEVVPSKELIAVTYDPSNGSVSNGDVWRNKQ